MNQQQKWISVLSDCLEQMSQVSNMERDKAWQAVLAAGNSLLDNALVSSEELASRVQVSERALGEIVMSDIGLEVVGQRDCAGGRRGWDVSDPGHLIRILRCVKTSNPASASFDVEIQVDFTDAIGPSIQISRNQVEVLLHAPIALPLAAPH